MIVYYVHNIFMLCNLNLLFLFSLKMAKENPCWLWHLPFSTIKSVMHNLSPFFLAVLGIIGVVLCCCLCRSCFCHYKKICKRSRKASQGLLVESTSSTTSSSPLDRLSGMDSTATSSRFGNNRYYSTFGRGVHFAQFSWVLFAIYILYVCTYIFIKIGQ